MPVMFAGLYSPRSPIGTPWSVSTVTLPARRTAAYLTYLVMRRPLYTKLKPRVRSEPDPAKVRVSCVRLLYVYPVLS